MKIVQIYDSNMTLHKENIQKQNKGDYSVLTTSENFLHLLCLIVIMRAFLESMLPYLRLESEDFDIDKNLRQKIYEASRLLRLSGFLDDESMRRLLEESEKKAERFLGGEILGPP